MSRVSRGLYIGPWNEMYQGHCVCDLPDEDLYGRNTFGIPYLILTELCQSSLGISSGQAVVGVCSKLLDESVVGEGVCWCRERLIGLAGDVR